MNPEQSHTISQVGDNTTPVPVSKTASSVAVTGYNMRCPAVKRLLWEAAELSTPEDDYSAHPTETNLFEWHFTIRGPESSEFEVGVYHGRIIFPSEYPMKPPSFILLTPNGRFQTDEKICLSISNYHPETWLPSWSIRTALVALRSFMTTPGNEGAIGSLNFSPEERKKLANKSRSWECRECGPIVKLLPLQPERAESAKDTKDSAEAPPVACSNNVRTGNPEEIAQGSGKSDANSHAKNRKCESTAAMPAVNRSAKPNANNPEVDVGASAALHSEGSSDALDAGSDLQQQQHEPIKNIIYDLGIGCFVVLILALCLRRLFAIFHTL